jgi:mRNA interferase MazF
MGVPATGQVVLLPFPISDLSRTKIRPAVILEEAGRDDWILSQITSNPYGDSRSIPLAVRDHIS